MSEILENYVTRLFSFEKQILDMELINLIRIVCRDIWHPAKDFLYRFFGSSLHLLGHSRRLDLEPEGATRQKSHIP